MAGQDNIVLRHLVWHDTCGGCHSSLTPSGLVALSRESIRGVNLLNVYFKMTCKSVRWRILFKGALRFILELHQLVLEGLALLVLTLIQPLKRLQARLSSQGRDNMEQLLGKTPIRASATEHDTVGPARIECAPAAIARRGAPFAPVAHVHLAPAVATAQ